MTIDELKSLLSHFNIRPDKRLGQNFLLSEKVLDEIVASAQLTKLDKVLEIGPGLGVLTRRLGEAAGEVIAVEKDRKLYTVLKKLFKRDENVEILLGDALYTDVILNAVKNLDSSVAPFPQNDKHESAYKLVANIPYYITGKLLQNFLALPAHNSSQPPLTLRGGVKTPSLRIREGGLPRPTSERVEAGGELLYRPSLIVLLLQKEVAERVTAKPGEMSLLSVSVQMYSDPEIISLVGKENFYPIPEVDSAVVRLAVLPAPRLPVDERQFFQLVKIGFSNKRKQLHNNLASGFGPRDWKQVLASIDLDPLCRAQDLSIASWGKLFDKTR